MHVCACVRLEADINEPTIQMSCTHAGNGPKLLHLIARRDDAVCPHSVLVCTWKYACLYVRVGKLTSGWMKRRMRARNILRVKIMFVMVYPHCMWHVSWYGCMHEIRHAHITAPACVQSVVHRRKQVYAYKCHVNRCMHTGAWDISWATDISYAHENCTRCVCQLVHSVGGREKINIHVHIETFRGWGKKCRRLQIFEYPFCGFLFATQPVENSDRLHPEQTRIHSYRDLPAFPKTLDKPAISFLWT